MKAKLYQIKQPARKESLLAPYALWRAALHEPGWKLDVGVHDPAHRLIHCSRRFWVNKGRRSKIAVTALFA